MKNHILKLATVFGITVATNFSAMAATDSNNSNQLSVEQAVVSNYADIVYANYSDAYAAALNLQLAIKNFLDNPDKENLDAAKQAWLQSRESYGQTEAFRFYDGPIDFVDLKTGEEGPEGALNAWPLNEAYIDYVQGNAKAGIVQDSSVEITKELLRNDNQKNDEADVATGYHAIEFLLWGQDFSATEPGNRPVSDYARTDANKNRRDYLRIVTEILTEDLKFLKDSWEPGKDNFAKQFEQQPVQQSLSKILTSLATLSGFELASERMATAIDSGDQEDEHSCFSDNTHRDFIANAKGISNIFFGNYGEKNGDSLYNLIENKDPDLARRLKNQLAETEILINDIPHPFDQKVLASTASSQGRKQTELAIASLQKQTDLFKEAGKVLGLEVSVASE